MLVRTSVLAGRIEVCVMKKVLAGIVDTSVVVSGGRIEVWVMKLSEVVVYVMNSVLAGNVETTSVVDAG